MAKEKTVYVCTNCGQESPKWAGKCPSCGQWNTFVEEVVRKEAPIAKHVAHGIESVRSKPQRLTEIESNEEQRMDMLDEELNRVLGGGLVQGSLTLIGGEPGIGKSTLILQTVLRLTHKRILYVSGEESARQLKLRAVRIPHPENDNLLIACETSLEQIFTHIKNAAPDLVIIDSIQTISTENIDSSPGSIVQVKECTASLLKFAKETAHRLSSSDISTRKEASPDRRYWNTSSIPYCNSKETNTTCTASCGASRTDSVVRLNWESTKCARTDYGR